MVKTAEPTPHSPVTVGFIGLGRMGAGMARNVLRAGFPLVVYNRSPHKVQPFEAMGARVAGSPREVAETSDILFTSLMDDKSVFEVLGAADGIVAGMRAGAIHVSTSTISPEAATRMAAIHRDHGGHLVAANVLGRPTAAEAGQLAALLAGEPEVIRRCRPVVETFATMILEVGRHPAAAARMKLVINFFLSGVIETIGEAYVLAEKHGLDTGTVETLIVDQVLPNPALREYAERIKNRRFDEAGATLATAVKDLQMILSEASAVNAPVPIANLVRDHILTAIAHGKGDQDWCVSTWANRLNAGLD